MLAEIMPLPLAAMHWEVLIIPVIALGVWILGTLFRTEEERPPTPLRRGSPVRPGQRRPVTDLDRFLEEARRRREAEQKSQAPPSVRPQAAPRPAPPARRATRPRVTVPEPTRTTAPRARPAEPVPMAAPVAAPVVPIASPVAVPAPSAESLPVAEVVKPSGQQDKGFDVVSPALAAAARQGRPAPVVPLVLGLLRSPQSAAAAFVLREILDRPLCKRRR